MSAVDVLSQLSSLRVAVTPTPRGTLWLEPASVIPPDLVEAVRQHKQAIMALLLRKHGYRQVYPGDGLPGDQELAEIERRVEEEGYVLLWSTVLEDLVAFYKTEADRKRIPPGFVPYSVAEMDELFGEGEEAPSTSALRLIHEAKKCGAHVKESVEDSEP